MFEYNLFGAMKVSMKFINTNVLHAKNFEKDWYSYYATIDNLIVAVMGTLLRSRMKLPKDYI
jgi:hypothetical protein